MHALFESTGRIAMNVLKAMVVILFSAMVVLVFTQVFTRYLTDSSLVWSEELARFCMIWMVFLASVITFKTNGHIIVDALVSQVKGRRKLLLLIVSKFMVLLYSLFIVVGAKQFLPVISIQNSPVLRINMAHVYIIIPISMACIGIICIQDIYALVRSLFEKKASINDEEVKG